MGLFALAEEDAIVKSNFVCLRCLVGVSVVSERLTLRLEVRPLFKGVVGWEQGFGESVIGGG